MSEGDLSPARIKPGYVLRTEEITEPEMSEQDWNDFAGGVTLFNRGEYWESHEAWEYIWKRHSEPTRVFFQALIQLAAAYHQLDRGIHHGVIKHFRNSETKLRPFPTRFLGVDLQPIKQALSAGVEETTRLGQGDLGAFDPELIARIDFIRPGQV